MARWDALRGVVSAERAAHWAAAAACVLLALAPITAASQSYSVLDQGTPYDHGLLGEARQAYRERADFQRGRDAYRLFKQYYAEHPDDPVAAWHFSVACYYMGHRILRESDARKQVHDEGRKAADHGVALDPECGPCYLMSAINHALWGEQHGMLRSIVGLPRVWRSLNQAARLDPTFAGAAPHRTMAMLMRAIPRMLGGGKHKALMHIAEALRHAPEEPLNYEFMVELKISENDLDGALRWAQLGVAVPEPPPEYVESKDAQVFMQSVIDHIVARQRAEQAARTAKKD